MTDSVEFKLNRQKAIEAMVYLATKRPRIDVFHICKVLFYADLNHLRQYGRPILGDTYCAMDDGPVPSFVLDVAKRNRRFISDEIYAYAAEKLDVDESDGYVRLRARGEFDDSSFSRTDIECLDQAIEDYADMEFLELWRLVHKETAFLAKYHSGTSTPIPYELFIPEDTPNREKMIEQLKETAAITDI